MAGAAAKYRHLSRTSSHRQALLRNLVTSLFEHESISTTWHKAKEAQRLAEKLITLGKKNTEASRRKAHEIFYRPLELVPKLFGPIAQRYATRPGGYTRVLRIEPLKEDQAPSAILELVDGPKDMRFAMTARTVANIRTASAAANRPVSINDITATNIKKATRFRENGEQELERMVGQMEQLMREEKADEERWEEEKGNKERKRRDRDRELEKRVQGREPRRRSVYPDRMSENGRRGHKRGR
ncbi:54S ribosomal protein L8, mitochondrial [Coniosporium apollinis]|uniref:54S ribosomal protein L8, mitochondrial n=1 Tax=Coniosporium apollinis TaxID=61459 RepID=A0ABQ9NID7_9PEZI|nr:54S ribosomal protein L8, mitochondrial [Coniosporium apollinis]